MRSLFAILLFVLAGCATTSTRVDTVPTPALDEAKVLAIARRAVAARETWIDRAEFKTPQRCADGSWSVMVWRLPKVFGGDRTVSIDEKGEVIGYFYGF